MMKATLQSFRQCYKCDTCTWFDMCTVWFVASLSCIDSHEIIIMVMSYPLVYNHPPSVIINLMA